jgi:hypothetical protein
MLPHRLSAASDLRPANFAHSTPRKERIVLTGRRILFSGSGLASGFGATNKTMKTRPGPASFMRDASELR